jgi:hypothetical protein
MAAVRELGSGASSVTARRIAYETALSNGYDLVEDDISIIDVAVDYGTYNPGLTASYEVSVTVDSGIDAAFAQFVYDSFLDVNAQSTMEVVLSRSPFAGFGMVSLANTCGNGEAFSSTGGGNSGGISVYGGTMLSNIPFSGCAYDPPNNGDGFFACTVPFEIGNRSAEQACLDEGGQIIDLLAVGPTNNCSGNGCGGNASPIQDNFNNGIALPDPLTDLPAPKCLGNENNPNPAKINGHFQPGYYTGNLGAGVYDPGIYCVKDFDISFTQGTMDATSGVLFYLYGAGSTASSMEIKGQAVMLINAPGNGSTCPHAPQPLDNDAAYRDPCNYKGLAIFTQQGQVNEISLGGNGGFNTYGTIYGNKTLFNAHGGGNSVWEIQVHGQILTERALNNGNGSTQVWYDENYAYIVPPYINALN